MFIKILFVGAAARQLPPWVRPWTNLRFYAGIFPEETGENK